MYLFLGGSSLELEPLVEDLVSILKNEVHNRKNKNVEVLQLAQNITRRMNGRYKCKAILMHTFQISISGFTTCL